MPNRKRRKGTTARPRNPKLGWMDRETLLSHYPALAQYVSSDQPTHRYRVHGLTKSVLWSEPESARSASTRGLRDDWRTSQQDWRVLDRSGMELGQVIPKHIGSAWHEGSMNIPDSFGESIIDALVRIGDAYRVGFVLCETTNAKGRSETRIYVTPNWIALSEMVDARAAHLKKEVLIGLAMLKGPDAVQVVGPQALDTTIEVLHLLNLLGLTFRNSFTGDPTWIIRCLQTPMPAAGMRGSIGVVKPSNLGMVCVSTRREERRVFLLDANGLEVGRLQVGTWANTPDGRIGEDDASAPAETVGQAVNRLKHVHEVDIARIRTIVEWTNSRAHELNGDGAETEHVLGTTVNVRVLPDSAPNIKDWALTGYLVDQIATAGAPPASGDIVM